MFQDSRLSKLHAVPLHNHERVAFLLGLADHQISRSLELFEYMLVSK
jgi:hypothetical protein